MGRGRGNPESLSELSGEAPSRSSAGRGHVASPGGSAAVMSPAPARLGKGAGPGAGPWTGGGGGGMSQWPGGRPRRQRGRQGPLLPAGKGQAPAAEGAGDSRVRIPLQLFGPRRSPLSMTAREIHQNAMGERAQPGASISNASGPRFISRSLGVPGPGNLSAEEKQTTKPKKTTKRGSLSCGAGLLMGEMRAT